jgi:putative membrane protein
VLAISVALNIAQVFLGEWQLTLRATETSLRRTSGLLSRTSKASTVARVQVVSSTQNPLQRRAGIRQVQLSTIGDGDLILVGCDDKQLDTVRRLAHVDRDLAPLARRIHPAQTYLVVRNALVVLVPVAFVGALFVNPFVAALPLLAVPVWLVSRREVRTTRWGIGSELALTKQVVRTETRQTVLRKTNVVLVTQTIFQRRRSLAQVDVVTAAGTVSIGMLALEEAHALRDHILAAVETDRLSWM